MRSLTMMRTSALALALTVTLSACGDTKDEERRQAAGVNPSLEDLLKVATVEAGKKKYGQCLGCHTINQGGMDKGGPNLFGVYNRQWGAGSRRFGYTAGLASGGGKWDAKTLNAWMQNPVAVIPKTSMQIAGVPDPLDRADIIAYLRSETPAL